PDAAADVVVEPGMGIYTFVASTMMSLFLTHVILHFDRSVTVQHKVLAMELYETEALRVHHFKISGTMARCTRLGQILLPMMVLFAAGSLCAGAAIESFEFVFKGAAGALLQILGTSPSTPYSLISLAERMPDSSSDPNSFGVRFLQATFFT